MVFDRIKDIMVEKLGIDGEDLGKDTSFEELGVDSLDIVELTMALEEEFEIEIAVSEDMKTVGDLVEFIETKM